MIALVGPEKLSLFYSQYFVVFLGRPQTPASRMSPCTLEVRGGGPPGQAVAVSVCKK
jgi:hypothetical protein